MRIDRRLTLLGVMLVVLSTVMATQYATTRVGYSFNIVHPSNADIRYVGADNSSTDGLRVLRVNSSTGNSSNARLTLELGDWMANSNKTYTAAFAIVNEEPFALNITHATVTNESAGQNQYIQIWLHSNGSIKATEDEYQVLIYNNGSTDYDKDTTAWRLARGDMYPTTMRTSASADAGDSGNVSTPWDPHANVRYCVDADDYSSYLKAGYGIGQSGKTKDTAADFVWVQISIVVPDLGVIPDEHSGTINIHFEADTHWGRQGDP